MEIISRLVIALVAFFVPAKTVAPFEDRVRDLIEAANAEAQTAYLKADSLNELSVEISVASSRSRDYARRINGLAGKLDSVVQ